MWTQDLMILSGLAELGEIPDSLEDYRELFRCLSLIC